MLNINVKAEFGEALKALADCESQVAYATARALNATAENLQETLRSEMKAVFKGGPTPYTLNSLFLRRATKSRLEAVVWLKTRNRPEHYLLPQIQGGGRPMKRFEERLQAMGLMRLDQRAVPASDVKLDGYGNMTKGQISQIMSHLRADSAKGVAQAVGYGKRSKSKRTSVEYFVSRGRSSQRYGYAGRSKGAMYSQHLPAGVYVRYRTPWGSAVKPVLIFVSATRYSKRFDFFGIAERVVGSRLPLHIQVFVQEAMRTARLSQQGSLF